MNQRDKRKLFWIVLFSMVNSVLGVVGIASILPFVAIISEPELIESNRYILLFIEYTGISAYTDLVLVFGVLSFLLVLVGNLLMVLESWLATRFSYEKEGELSKKLLGVYLDSEPKKFLRKKNSEKTKLVLSEVDRVILDTFFGFLTMVANIVAALLIILLLMVVNLKATLVIFGCILAAYLFIHYFISKKLDDWGKEFADLETDVYSQVLQALDLYKEIKLSGAKKYFLTRYSSAFNKMIKNRFKVELISLIPQQIIEVITFGSILLIAVYFTINPVPDTSLIAMISVYAFAAYRLMPAISIVFDNLESIIFGSAILKPLVREITQDDKKIDSDSSIVFNQTIELSKVGFYFDKSASFKFENLSLSFEADKFHCIKGKSGCGKSTLLGIISGLYQAKAGEVLIDKKNTVLYENPHWKSIIGYVPPRVNLINATILENIAFGIDLNSIDRDRINLVTEWAQLDDYIESLPQGYQTIYGDNGIEFSTGQIQRLGIARALYHKPKLLLLDEATDALDIETEGKVLNNLKEKFSHTIIFVSHRPSVHNFVDNVVDLEKDLDS